MSIAAFRRAVVRKFRGAMTAPDAITLAPNSATSAVNVEFGNDSVGNRTGFADTAITPGAATSGAYNWIFLNAQAGQATYLVWSTVAGAIAYAPATSLASVITAAYTAAGGAYGATFAPHGARLYIAHFGTDMLGKDHAHVISFAGQPTGSVDKLFPRPMLTSEVSISITLSPGIGDLTPGTKNVAFILERRSGYIGAPGPVSTPSLTLVPGTFNVTTEKIATISISPTVAWPADAVKIHLLMTTSANRSRYLFVPGATAAVVGGSPGLAFFTVTISDDDLVRNGDEATPYLGLVSQDNLGNPPFSPISVFRAGERMAYCVNDPNYPACVFFSRKNNPQAIDVGKNIRYFPQYVHGGFELFGVYYCFGPSWTYSSQDTAEEPVSWAAPRLVDSGIGSPSPWGVAVNTSQGTAWVAHQSGLYRFSGGAYDVTPVSRYQYEWSLIDWSKPYNLFVCDDPIRKKVRVIATMIDTSNRELVFDYTNGVTAETVNFATYSITGSNMGSQSLIVLNTAKKIQECWLAPSSGAQPFRRQKAPVGDDSPFTDGPGLAIADQYETPPLLQGKGPTTLSQHHGDQIRIAGLGSVNVTPFTLDENSSGPLRTQALALHPDQWPLLRYYMLCEDVRLKIASDGTPGTNWRLSAIEHLWTTHAAQR
jgi:hypothetical protein